MKVGELAKLDIEGPTSGEVYGSPRGRTHTHTQGGWMLIEPLPTEPAHPTPNTPRGLDID